MTIDKRVLREEARLAKSIFADFKKLGRKLVKILQNKYPIRDTIKKDIYTDLFVALGEDREAIINKITMRATISIQIGYATAIAEHPIIKQIVSKGKLDRAAAIYIDSVRELHLSDVQGSILHTTKEGIRKVIVDGLEKGLGVETVAENMRAQITAGFLSEDRAQLIAQNQIKYAYELGVRYPYDVMQTNGYRVRKRRLTVGDDRVTPSHTQNEADDWIEYSDTFSGTGDMMPPASDNPRCRCTLQYEINGVS